MSTQLKIMFHDDWELFGDGSGDIQSLMFDPARKILDLCDQVGAKYTFFAEIGQQFAMKASSVPAHQNQSLEWESILKEAVRRGHDVQLHFHPQWIGAKFIEGKWNLDYSKWSTARLEKEELKAWLKKGADYLRSLLKGVSLEYDVVAYRGGGYMVQPSGNLISVLKEIGIRADTTVIKGMKMENESMGNVDFSYAPSSIEPWAPTSDDLATKSSRYDNLLCIPTYSFPTRLPSSLFSVLRSPTSAPHVIAHYLHSKKQSYTPVYFRSNGRSSRPVSQAEKIFKERTLTCDFGVMHHAVIMKEVEKVHHQGEKEGKPFLPMILYTHSKTFYSYENFKSLLKKLSQKSWVQFGTMREIVADVEKSWVASK